MICGSNGYERKLRCPHGHWCTGYSNESSLVVSSMDLCENGTIEIRIDALPTNYRFLSGGIMQKISFSFSANINCRGGHRAPQCSLCKVSLGSTDDVYNSWCDGNCYFDQRDNVCKTDGRLKVNQTLCLMF